MVLHAQSLALRHRLENNQSTTFQYVTDHLEHDMEHKGVAEGSKLDSFHLGRELHPTTTDDVRLEEIGFTEELERKFSVWSLAALVLCLMGTWEAVGSTMAQALIGGGAPCLIYN